MNHQTTPGGLRALAAEASQRLGYSACTARTFLRAHGRELEAVVELLRALALVSGGARGDVRAESVSSVLALLRIFRDSPGGSAPVIVLETTRAVALVAEMRARGRVRGGVLAALEMAKLVSRGAILAAQAGRVLTEAQTRLARNDAPRCTCGVGSVPGAGDVRARAGTRSGRVILAPKEGGAEGAPDVLDALFEVGFERRRAASFVALAHGPAGCPKCRPKTPAVPGDSTSEAVAVREPRPEEMAAEVLHIARPVVQLLLLRMFGWRSWRAWLGSLAVDVASSVLVKQPETQNEMDEVRRRQMMMLLYFVRSPLFDFIIRVFIRRLERMLRRIPIIGGPVSASVELVVMLQRFWFYTSGS